MKKTKNSTVLDTIIAAFSQGMTFGFGYRDSVRDLRAAHKR